MAHPVDPRWKEISASRRAAYLYVKMPRATARRLAFCLQLTPELCSDKVRTIASFLMEQVAQDSATSLYYRLDLGTAWKEIETLSVFKDTLVQNYLRVLRAGLASDPDVDWITRVGGPLPSSSLPIGLEPL